MNNEILVVLPDYNWIVKYNQGAQTHSGWKRNVHGTLIPSIFHNFDVMDAMIRKRKFGFMFSNTTSLSVASSYLAHNETLLNA